MNTTPTPTELVKTFSCGAYRAFKVPGLQVSIRADQVNPDYVSELRAFASRKLRVAAMIEAHLRGETVSNPDALLP